MDERDDRRADSWSGAGWIGFGALVVAMSLSMDRMEHLGGTAYTAPGFVPMLLGLALCLCGAIMLLRARWGRIVPFVERTDRSSLRRALGALALLVAYAVGLVGRVPFPVATALFVTAFIVVFSLPIEGRRARALLAAKALATGLITAGVVSAVFQEIFFIRLP